MLAHYHVLPAVDPAVASNSTLVGFGVVSAIFYAAGLAFGAESLAGVGLEVGRAVEPMLATPADDLDSALALLGPDLVVE